MSHYNLFLSILVMCNFFAHNTSKAQSISSYDGIKKYFFEPFKIHLNAYKAFDEGFNKNDHKAMQKIAEENKDLTWLKCVRKPTSRDFVTSFYMLKLILSVYADDVDSAQKIITEHPAVVITSYEPLMSPLYFVKSLRMTKILVKNGLRTEMNLSPLGSFYKQTSPSSWISLTQADRFRNIEELQATTTYLEWIEKKEQKEARKQLFIALGMMITKIFLIIKFGQYLMKDMHNIETRIESEKRELNSIRLELTALKHDLQAS